MVRSRTELDSRALNANAPQRHLQALLPRLSQPPQRQFDLRPLSYDNPKVRSPSFILILL